MTHILTVEVPTVPFGPENIPVVDRDATYYREAAKNIRYQAMQDNRFAGSNVTETVARLCIAVAKSLEGRSPTTGRRSGIFAQPSFRARCAECGEVSPGPYERESDARADLRTHLELVHDALEEYDPNGRIHNA